MSDVNTGEGNDPSTTEDDVQASLEEVAALREELAELNQQTSQIETSATHAVLKARIDREAASLREQVEEARQRLEVAQADTGPVDSEGAADTATGVTGVFASGNAQPEVNEETGEVEADQVYAFMANAAGEDYNPDDPDSDGSSLVDATDGEQ